jgi:uncharacterized membrane protein HdeD (DUF308 family)
MLQLLSKTWWVFVLRGVLAILFGIAAFVMPGVTLAALILIYAVYALMDGAFALVAAFSRRSAGEGFPWSVLLIGLAGIFAGIIAFVYPGATALVLLYLIAAWHIVRGAFEVAVAIRLRKEIEGEGWLIAAGLMSILFGAFLVLRPAAGALALLWVIGSFAIIFGILLIALGFRLKSLGAGVREQGSGVR